MSEDMFSGRKFTIPYDTSTDQQVASMARAQIVTRTASPGQIIQVGDKVLAYGVTPQQAKMGDLDVKIRSYQQLTNEAQEAVRRNIQWQYGEQVGEPVKKGLLARLLGIPHFAVGKQDLYPEVPGRNRRSLPKADMVKIDPPAPVAPAPAATAPAKPTAAPAQPAATKKTASKAPKADAPKANTPTADKKSPASWSSGMRTEFITAAQNLAYEHRNYRASALWSTTTDESSPMRFVSTSKDLRGGNTETHELEFNPDTKKFTHRYTAPGSTKPVETVLESTAALHRHVNTPNKTWGF